MSDFTISSITIMFPQFKKFFFYFYIFRAPFKVYLVLAFLTVATMGLSNMAVGYLNYPTQVIFKCCKLIPVLVGGIIIQGQ